MTQNISLLLSVSNLVILSDHLTLRPLPQPDVDGQLNTVDNFHSDLKQVSESLGLVINSSLDIIIN